MIKVHILDTCPHCDGEAYLPAGEAVSVDGERYEQYQPCPKCQGSGKAERWIGLGEFADLVVEELGKNPFEPDYQQLAQQRATSQFADSCDAAGI
jgi:Zn-finger nucleic acid-binding protein